MSQPMSMDTEAENPESQPVQSDQKTYNLHSIIATVIIRQLPSQGIAFQLWPAATTLVNLLDRHRSSDHHTNTTPFFNSSSGDRLRLLELGSGTGVVGIAAAALLGASVTVTDLPHVLPNLEFNVEANAGILKLHDGTVNVAALSWGEIENMKAIGRKYDVIVGSDVVYHDHLYEPLIETLKFFLLGNEKSVLFLMAHLKRWKKESAFFKKAKKFFDVDVIHCDDPCDGSRVGVNVYRFVSKDSKKLNCVVSS